MEILIIVLLSAWHHSRCWDGWLGCLLSEHGPIILLLIKVPKPVLWNTVRNANVDSIWRENSMDLIQHLVTVWASIVSSAEDWVKAGLVNDRIESTILKLQALCIHLLIRHLRNLFLVVLLHLLDNCEGDVDVCDLLVAILEHLFAHLGVAASNVQDLERGLDVLSDHVLYSCVPLVPIERFLVLLVPIFPVIWLSVMSHFWISNLI